MTSPISPRPMPTACTPSHQVPQTQSQVKSVALPIIGGAPTHSSLTVLNVALRERYSIFEIIKKDIETRRAVILDDISYTFSEKEIAEVQQRTFEAVDTAEHTPVIPPLERATAEDKALNCASQLLAMQYVHLYKKYNALKLKCSTLKEKVGKKNRLLKNIRQLLEKRKAESDQAPKSKRISGETRSATNS